MLATRAGTHLPVSVKTRTGIRKHDTERWISQLIEAGPAAITLHGRTQKQQSEGVADWNEIAKAARIRDELNPEIPILGNGDVLSYAQALEYSRAYQLDGVMIGRGIFYDPWFFNSELHHPSKEEKLRQLILHTRLFERNWGRLKNFNVLKRFYKVYTHGFAGASQIRADLMNARSYEEVYRIAQLQFE